MMMPMVANGGLLVTDVSGKPGFAFVLGGPLKKGLEMSLQESEQFKDDYIRSKLGLQNNELHLTKPEPMPRTCKRCQRPSSLCCKVCRMSYCSKSCQRRDWRWHVFICSIKNRPNDFDHLRVFLLQRFKITRDEVARSKFLVDLFSDDHICKTFGFVNCLNSEEVLHLLCIYGIFTHQFKSAIGWLGRHCGNLGKFVEVWARAHQDCNRSASNNCDCIPWFLEQRSKGFDIPNWERQYLYQAVGVQAAECIFLLPSTGENPMPRSSAEIAVFSLYSYLLRTFNNIPDVYSSEWAKFGFWLCTTRNESESLANAYLQLAGSGASLGEIAYAWKTSSPSELLRSRV
jgi:hypothetical protein